VSDDGKEIYKFFAQEGTPNVAHHGRPPRHMVRLGRSFGIRMTRLGMNVVLVRDLTGRDVRPAATAARQPRPRHRAVATN